MAGAEQRQHTFLFADLSGFTTLTEAHGDVEAADLAGEFFEEARRLLGEHGAEEVKTLGDEVMVRCESARDAIGLGLMMVQVVGERHGFLNIRVGLNTGSAVERDGDWFGAAVNIAARVAAVAGAGQVLLTAASAAAAGAPEGGELGRVQAHERVVLQSTGVRELRNVAEPVELFEASCERSRSAIALPIDPVCRMTVDPERAAAKVMHAGIEYSFCSAECARKFAAAPDTYLAAATQSMP